MSFEDIWVNLTPKQVKEFIELFYTNKNLDIQIQYNLAWLNSCYNHISRYNRKEFPKQPEKILKEEKKDIKNFQSDSEQEAILEILISQI